MLELVCCYVGDRELATPISGVRETVPMRPITPVFGVPRALAGIANLRGEILAILDLHAMLGLATRAAPPDQARILVVEHEGRSAGLIVDRLGAIRSVDETAIREPPATLAPATARLLAGVVSLPDAPLAILDPGRLFAMPELADIVRPPRGHRPEHH